MSLLSKLFGGGKSQPEPEIHEGFRIFPEPIKEDGGYRLAARIEKEIGGEICTHQLIRADVIGDRDEASAAALQKAKQLIDQMGEGLFG